MPLLGWVVLCVAGNAINIPLFEESGLEERFGDDFRRYKANMPRRIPRLKPWANANHM